MALCLREFSNGTGGAASPPRRHVTERGGNLFYIAVDAEEYTEARGFYGAGNFFLSMQILRISRER